MISAQNVLGPITYLPDKCHYTLFPSKQSLPILNTTPTTPYLSAFQVLL